MVYKNHLTLRMIADFQGRKTFQQHPPGNKNKKVGPVQARATAYRNIFQILLIGITYHGMDMMSHFVINGDFQDSNNFIHQNRKF